MSSLTDFRRAMMAARHRTREDTLSAHTRWGRIQVTVQPGKNVKPLSGYLTRDEVVRFLGALRRPILSSVD
jgi:hypothetical protein